jgi:hypothetical protein
MKKQGRHLYFRQEKHEGLEGRNFDRINKIYMIVEKAGRFPQIDRFGFGRNLGVVFIRFCLALIVFVMVVAAPLRAQTEPIHMRPEFPLVFPLTTSGQDNTDVTVKYPVMINPATTLKPGMVLRVLYVLSNATQGSSDLILAHEGTLEQSYARNAFGANGSDENKMPPEIAHEIEGYRRTVWQVPNNFILAMAQYPTDSMHLIYSGAGKTNDLKDERFSFFDGLFVGLPDGKVTVIAVEKTSKADKAGLKAGDEILAVGGISTQSDLATFASAYATAKKVATENAMESYTMTFSRGSSGSQTANILLPPKLSGSLMNDFFDSGKPKKQETPPAPATP